MSLRLGSPGLTMGTEAVRLEKNRRCTWIDFSTEVLLLGYLCGAISSEPVVSFPTLCNREGERSKGQCNHREAIGYYFVKIKTCISYDLAIPLPRINSGETHAYIHTENAHCSIAHNCQNLEPTQMLIHRSMHS